MITAEVYTEKQRFKQWWIWLIILFLNGTTLYAAISQIYKGKPFGQNPMSDTSLLFMTGFVLLFNLLFFYLKLETRIDAMGIAVRFFPFHLRERQYKWEEIKSVELRTYKPIAEYGGWGLRGFGANKALNVSGNLGLHIIFQNGNTLLIGTNDSEGVSSILKELGKI